MQSPLSYSASAFLFELQQLGLIAFRIYNTEKTERLIKGIAQLVRRKRRDVQGIEKSHGVHFFVGEHCSLSSDAYHDMFVPVFFETAVAAWKYLKISEVKFCGFTGIANNNLPHRMSLKL